MDKSKSKIEEKMSQSEWIKKNTNGLKKIGQGEFGTVFSFEDSEGRKKALKVTDYRKEYGTVGKWLEEAIEEIKCIQKLKECNSIIKIEEYFADLEENLIYIVTALADCNLLDYLKKNKIGLQNNEVANIKVIVEIMKCILNGLLHAHERKIVHRDMIPENVLLVNGSFIISDWGQARQLDKDHTDVHNLKIRRKDFYLSPELIKNYHEKIYTANLYKAEAYSAGILFLVCFGVPEETLIYLDKYDETFHIQKIEILTSEIGKSYPELGRLISGLTTFNPKDRKTIKDAVEILGKLYP